MIFPLINQSLIPELDSQLGFACLLQYLRKHKVVGEQLTMNV